LDGVKDTRFFPYCLKSKGKFEDPVSKRPSGTLPKLLGDHKEKGVEGEEEGKKKTRDGTERKDSKKKQETNKILL